MAYGAMFPQNYQQPYQQAYQPQYYGNMQNAPQMPQNAPAQSNNGITWVQGEAAAKSFPVGAGQSALLMDSEESVFYIKSTDQSGMPQPLRIFDYTERTAQHSEAGITKKPDVDYVSRSEFEEFREDVKRSIKGIRRPRIEEDEE
jgi:hypothetical protein